MVGAVGVRNVWVGSGWRGYWASWQLVGTAGRANSWCCVELIR